MKKSINEYAVATLDRIKNRKLYSAIVAMLSVACFLAFTIWVPAGSKRIIIYAFLCFGSGILLLLPEFNDNKVTIPLTVLYLLIVPAKIFERLELPMHDMSHLLSGVKGLSVLIILCVYFVIFIVTQKTQWAFGIGNILIMFFFLLNYFSFCLKGTIITLNDIKHIDTVMALLGEYTYAPSAEAGYSLLYMAFFIILGFRLKIKGNKVFHISLTIVLGIFVAFCYYLVMVSQYPVEKGMKGWYWDEKQNQISNGTILSNFILCRENKNNVAEKYDMEYPQKWYEKYRVVCHALGMTQEGDTLTNSREAFLYNYKLGQRVFEADMQITSDNIMVLRHDWDSDLGQAASFGWTEEQKEIPTAEEFLEAPIYGKYTPLTLLDCFELMQEYPDVYIVTDTKFSQDVASQFGILVNTALQNGYEDVLSRVVVQIYYQDMYDEVMSVYPFENVLWTLYYIGYPGGDEIKQFCKEKQVPVVVMPESDWGQQQQQELADSSDIQVYLHTVNDEEKAEWIFSVGADGIYSDWIIDKGVRNE